ncbi:MAG TPA: OAM dimerization domain-containing protein [Holophaga sp.]|nr:OAM dimerization domain-containing protein [Holophaga sp.]HPS67655.1 OAM dimerization domain-containing protein [Holophaga sp.]
MIVRPYGDTLDDGAVQLSFTLPVPDGPRGREAARLFVEKLGFKHAEIVHSQPLSEGFSFYVAYGKTELGIDFDAVQVEEATGEQVYSMYEACDVIKEKLGRKVVVVGACTGFDAHTVGIDAIMNMKGYNHHYGLERYSEIEAHNLGAQVPNEKLIDYALKVNADAILISQIVTQKDVHIQNMTEFIELLQARGLREKFIVCVGGSRIGNKLAVELGYDAGFGKGTYADHVATYIIDRLIERKSAR